MSHLTESSLKGRSHKNNVIRKAMSSGLSVKVEILHDNLSENDAFAKEIELIAFFGRRRNGGCLTNATDGGDGVSGYRHTTETRQKIADHHSGMRHSEETRKRMSKIRTGKIQTETHKESIKHGQWDKNSAWLVADTIFDAWNSGSRPGWKALAKIVNHRNIEAMHRKFLEGWNPREDSVWSRYKAQRT